MKYILYDKDNILKILNVCNYSAELKETNNISDIKTTYNYDENGNLVEVKYDDILKESFKYNEFNQLIEYKNFNDGITSNYEYYADGLRKNKIVS